MSRAACRRATMTKATADFPHWSASGTVPDDHAAAAAFGEV
jgi:hypothetical protein